MRKKVEYADPSHPENQNVNSAADMLWETEVEENDWTRTFIGKVPIMLRSGYCNLHEIQRDQHGLDVEAMGECPYDQV